MNNKHASFPPKILSACFALFVSLSAFAQTEDKIELETTIIKGNTELPKILYVVPWQDELESKPGEQRLVLHSLFGDIFEPVTPTKAGRRIIVIKADE